jgi:signal transduction histidine kinase
VLPREDRLRVERILAGARVFLAAMATVVALVAPDDPSLLSGPSQVVLVAYALFAVAVLTTIRWQPQLVVASRMALHGVDLAVTALITVLSAGPGTPFFVFFIFVLLAAALRWGAGPTLITGAATIAWYLVGGLLESGFSAGEVEATRYFMRAAFLLIATLVLAQLAGTFAMFHAESEVLSGILARVKRGEGFTTTLQDVLEEGLRYTQSARALLVMKDEEEGRVYCWRVLRSDAAAATPLLTELSTPESEALFAAMPAGLSIWNSGPVRGDTMKLRGLDEVGTLTTVAVAAGPHRDLLAAEQADTYTGLRIQLAGWDGGLFLLGAPTADESTLHFLRRLAGHIAPAMHGQYLAARVRTRIGDLERARLARELHDGLIQSLIGLEMQLDALRRHTPAPAIGAELRTIQSRLHDSILDTRDLMAHLKPQTLGRESLLTELTVLIERFRHDTGIEARLVCNVEHVDTPARTSQELARIVQEALVNVRKHAGARNVIVRITRGDCWTLSIDDDGRGFAFSGRLTQDELDRQRRGPVVIKERVRAIGGELSIESEPGRGSRLAIVWPLGRRSLAGSRG